MARRDYPVVNLGIHPGELHPRLTRNKKPVFVNVDVVARASKVPGNDALQHVIQLGANEFVVVCVLQK